ncbi:MAG: hypothetical protein ACRD2W_23845 [Acidimicrobiales bacterium]
MNVLQLGATQALNVQAAAAGQSTFSQGLPGVGLFNELGYIVQPAGTPGNSFGRGVGLELGLVTPTPNPDPNQILLSGLATANAPPSTGLVQKQIGPIALGGVAFASLLRGSAQAIWDPNFCPVGKPFSFGQGEATNLQLVGTPGQDGSFGATALVGTTLGAADPRNVSYTKSLTYAVPNGDGTFGLVSETRQTIAPVSLLGGSITLEVLGEWALRAIATGKPGGARVEYAPVGAIATTPAVSLSILGAPPIILTTQDLFGAGGFDTEAILGALSLLVDLKIGTPERQLGGSGPPLESDDGTQAAGAVDVISLSLLSGLLAGITGADVRVGHMEAAVNVPAGGLRCTVPVDKSATPDPVPAGSDFVITITIPSDDATFAELFACDLIAIQVIDEHGIESGNPSFVLTGASNGGVINGNTVTWPNIGNYTIGSPPLQLTVTGRVAGNTQAGVLRDVANVTATLGNCDGTGAGEDIVGQGIGIVGNGTAITGSLTLIGPSVARGGVLAATGNDQRLLIAGGILLLGALGLRRKLRKPATA